MTSDTGSTMSATGVLQMLERAGSLSLSQTLAAAGGNAADLLCLLAEHVRAGRIELLVSPVDTRSIRVRWIEDAAS